MWWTLRVRAAAGGPEGVRGTSRTATHRVMRDSDGWRGAHLA